MRYVNELTQRMLAGEDTAEVLTLVGERARTLVGASAAWVVMPDTAGPDLRVVAAAGRVAGEIAGAALSPSTSLLARAMAGGRTVVVDHMKAEPSVWSEARSRGFGPGAYFPMISQDGPIAPWLWSVTPTPSRSTVSRVRLLRCSHRRPRRASPLAAPETSWRRCIWYLSMSGLPATCTTRSSNGCSGSVWVCRARTAWPAGPLARGSADPCRPSTR